MGTKKKSTKRNRGGGKPTKARASAKASRLRKKKTLPGRHPPHPKCPACGKAVYKSLEPAAVKRTDPWSWCRNRDCENFGRDLSKVRTRGAT